MLARHMQLRSCALYLIAAELLTKVPAWRISCTLTRSYCYVLYVVLMHTAVKNGVAQVW
jgi:hypothetical protein